MQVNDDDSSDWKFKFIGLPLIVFCMHFAWVSDDWRENVIERFGFDKPSAWQYDPESSVMPIADFRQAANTCLDDITPWTLKTIRFYPPTWGDVDKRTCMRSFGWTYPHAIPERQSTHPRRR